MHKSQPLMKLVDFASKNVTFSPYMYSQPQVCLLILEMIIQSFSPDQETMCFAQLEA